MLANDSSILLTGVDWLELSPHNYMNASIIRYVTSNTHMMLSVSYDLSIRPVISLSSNASIIGGDGSEVYPFIIKDSN